MRVTHVREADSSQRIQAVIASCMCLAPRSSLQDRLPYLSFLKHFLTINYEFTLDSPYKYNKTGKVRVT